MLFVVSFLVFPAMASAVAPIALCFSVMAAATPVLADARMMRPPATSSSRDLWPDVVDNITSGVRAGLGSAGGARSQLGGAWA